MKKLLIGSTLIFATSSAFAFDVGITGSHNYDANRNFGGVAVSQDFKRLNLAAGFEHSSTVNSKVDRWSVVGGIDLFKAGPVTLAAKAGGSLFVEGAGTHGYAGVAGLGVKVPLDKKITLTVDALRQWGETSVKGLDGNMVAVGLKYKL